MPSVYYFDSAMTGAPSLPNSAGALTGILTACLVDGFGGITLDSLVIASNLATGTFSSGHGFAMYGDCGPIVLIAGATPSGLNGEHRITVTSSTQFTFPISLANQTATGTITAKRASAGWDQPYSGTNKAVYQSTDSAGSQFCLRVDDTSGNYALVRGYESMTDVDTGTDPFPTIAQLASLYWQKSTGTTTGNGWWLVADSRTVLIGIASNTNYTSGYVPYFFGDIQSAYPADLYACAIVGSASNSAGLMYQEANASQSGHYLARDYSGSVKSIPFFKTSRAPRTATSWMGCADFANSASIARVSTPLLICTTEDSLNIVRGIFPGIYAPNLHPALGPTLSKSTGSDGDRLMLYLMGTHDDSPPTFSGVVAVDMTGLRP